MPNKKRASRWPKNILEGIFMYQDVNIENLPDDIINNLEYLFSRIHPNQRQVLLWFYKDGYTMKEMTKLDGNFTFDYIIACKEHGIKNLQRLSYFLTIGYNNFIKGYHIEEWPVSLLVDDLLAISYNALERVGITTVGDVLQYSKEELMNFNRVGEITIRKLENRLKEYGISLRQK